MRVLFPDRLPEQGNYPADARTTAAIKMIARTAPVAAQSDALCMILPQLEVAS